jgi:glucan-binding YG repeat protein
VEISGKWYFFESSGAMKTGWIQSSGDWYCLKSDGSMAAGEYVRGYWLNANGKWTYEYKFTWKQDSVGWYYIDTNGWYVKSDSVMIDGKVYDFDSRGYCTNP